MANKNEITSKKEASKKEKLVILGGGVGAMTTAFELTSHPNWKERYDSITVYQLGWRLGGKGASGRNMDPAYHYRIEEHGLHVWAGLYDNAFRMIRECYKELARPTDAPLATWQDAFKPQNFMVLQEVYKENIFDWTLTLPTNKQLPGEPNAQALLSLHSYVSEAIQVMLRLFNNLLSDLSSDHSTDSMAPDVNLSLESLTSEFDDPDSKDLYATAQEKINNFPQKSNGLIEWIEKILEWLAEEFVKNTTKILEEMAAYFLKKIMRLIWFLIRTKIDDLPYRQSWIYLNFAAGNLRGVLECDILRQGFDVVNHLDYREWLKQYVFDDNQLTINSPLAWFLYDADFAFTDGDLNKPDLSANAALYSLIRLVFTCKGAIIWKMQAGMGDTIFTPLYQVLKKRGVEFKFFHRVKNLNLSPDKKSIASITIERQANLKETDSAYNPLVTIKELDCWPSTPLYDQLEHGEELKQKKVDFEAWSCDRVVETITLQAEQDFDQVVLGISLGALPYICCDLIRHNKKWQDMVDNVKTVRTQALQLWLKPTDTELGWTLGGQPILDVHHITPLTTWADMTHLLNREGWPAKRDQHPLSIAYFCGPMKDEEAIPTTECGPKQDADALSQKKGNEQAHQVALDYLQKYIQHLWPKAHDDGRFNWELLVDDRASEHQGEDRLNSQYIRGNVQPSERYVMSVSGSTMYRLEPGNSGFNNLYLAGDWTQNSFNSGCVEAAAISGMLASHAICGYPKREEIVGLTFGHPEA